MSGDIVRLAKETGFDPKTCTFALGTFGNYDDAKAWLVSVAEQANNATRRRVEGS